MSRRVVITGLGQGKDLGAPTINLELEDVPTDLSEGIYACAVSFPDGEEFLAVLHFGPRPAVKAGPSCEVHLIDAEIDYAPDELTVQVLDRLRDVMDFGSVEELSEQIQRDISSARGILGIS